MAGALAHFTQCIGLIPSTTVNGWMEQNRMGQKTIAQRELQLVSHVTDKQTESESLSKVSTHDCRV